MKRTAWIATLVATLALVVANAASAQIVALGASNFAGQGVDSDAAFPAQLERMLAAKGFHVQVTSAGISGDTNAGMLGRLDSDVPAGTTIVILDASGGTFNARHKGLGDQAAELASIKARLRARGIGVIPLWGRSIEQKQADGLHFSVAGHALAAARLLPPVIQALGNQGRRDGSSPSDDRRLIR